jgi:hypothetical protein
VRLSYVKQYGDETTEPYALFKLLGLPPKAVPEDIVTETPDMLISFQAAKPDEIKYDRLSVASMFLCPYKYFLEYVMNDAPIIEGAFLYQKLYENILIENTWIAIQNKPKQTVIPHLDDIVKQKSDALVKYFWFWRLTEIDDLRRRAYNYIMNNIVNTDNGALVEAYYPAHAEFRKCYGKAKFVMDISEFEPQNAFAAFEQLAKREYPQKMYSLHSLPGQKDTGAASALLSNIRDYMEDRTRKDNAANVGEWCVYCPSKGICTEPYLQDR